MDTISGEEPMETPAPLSGLDPADLLRQGAAEDTLVDEAAPSFHPPSLDEMAEWFPRFEILGLIGQGGMGAVYKVRQKDLDRVVALKILPPAIGATPGFSGRFTREAKALAKLNHPAIVTLHEFGQTPSEPPLPFILMEFVDGVNLAQLMHSGRIAPREALAIVPQICDALQYAHDHGIVHRDIKPENILLDRVGRVKVADFGIAKVIEAAGDDAVGSGDTSVPADATIAGKILGTPQYMAPEQIDRPSEVDHRADIYALGVVFYQMLTGELPDKDLQAPSKKVSIDVRLDEIVMRAMEKKPEMRYQQASVFRTEVETLDDTKSASVNRSRTRLRRIVGIALILCLPLAIWVAFDQRSKQPVKYGVDYAFTIPKNTSEEKALSILTNALGAFPELSLSRLPDSRRWKISSAGTSQNDVETRVREAVEAVRHDLTSNQKRILSEPMVQEEMRTLSSPIFSWNHDSDFLVRLRGFLIAGMIFATIGLLLLLPSWNRRSSGWIVATGIAWFGITAGVFYQLRPDQSAGVDPWTKISIYPVATKRNSMPERGERTGNEYLKMDGAVREWLGLIDVGNFDAAWDEMSEGARSLQNKTGWEAMVIASRQPLGEVVKRKLIERRESSGLAGFGRLSNRGFKYQTEFKHGKGIETVTLVLEESGDLRVMSYVIEVDLAAAKDSASPASSSHLEESDVNNPARLADQFVTLDLANAKAEEMYQEGDPARVRIEAQWNAFVAEHPDFPNALSREVVTRKRLALLAEVDGLAKTLGAGHPKVVEAERKMKRLADLPEIGKKQFERETTERIPATDLPAGNRLEIRLVTPDDPTAETMISGKGTDTSSEIQVSREVIVCDRHLSNASFREDEDGGIINLTFDKVGAHRLVEATKTNLGRMRLAIVMDGKLESAPVVQAQLGSQIALPNRRTYEEYLDFYKSLPIWDANINYLPAANWLVEVDGGKLGESYSNASESFRDRISEAEWKRMVGQFRSSLGIVASRGPMLSYHEATVVSGDSETDYRLFTLKTHFAEKRDAVEIVSMVKDSDDVWRVDGYWIR